eukprot:2591433-Heterocapsa_arctica.AAC.1
MVEVTKGGGPFPFPKPLERHGAECSPLFVQTLQRVPQFARDNEHVGVSLAMEPPMVARVDPVQGLRDFHFPFEARNPYRSATAPGG